MSQDPLSVVQRWFEDVWNQRRADTIYELLTDDSICYTDAGLIRGAEQFRRLHYEPVIAAFPDLWIRIEDTLVEGDQVVVRWEMTGTHTGTGLGMPGTGRSVVITGMTWIRIKDGKFSEGWQQSSISNVFTSLRTPSMSTLDNLPTV